MKHPRSMSSKVLMAVATSLVALACVAQARAQAPSDQSLAGAQQHILSQKDAAARVAVTTRRHSGELIVSFIHRLEVKGVKFANMKHLVASGADLNLLSSLTRRAPSAPLRYGLQNKTVSFKLSVFPGTSTSFEPQGGHSITEETILFSGAAPSDCTVSFSFFMESSYDISSPTYSCVRFIQGDDDAAIDRLFKQAVADSLGFQTHLRPQP